MCIVCWWIIPLAIGPALLISMILPFSWSQTTCLLAKLAGVMSRAVCTCYIRIDPVCSRYSRKQLNHNKVDKIFWVFLSWLLYCLSELMQLWLCDFVSTADGWIKTFTGDKSCTSHQLNSVKEIVVIWMCQCTMCQKQTRVTGFCEAKNAMCFPK